MDEKKIKSKRNRHLPSKSLAIAAVLLAIVCLVRIGVQCFSFASGIIYDESTDHLEEILHKSNNMLSEIAKKNISYLHLWNGFLDSNPDDDGIQVYLESAKQELGFVDFYFLNYDGNYMTPGGKTGYLGLQSDLDERLADNEDIVMNAVLPGQDPMLVFICPETKGVYRGFAYDAIAISRRNDIVMKSVDSSAFGGTASSYVIYPDGQVVIENIPEGKESIYNLLAVLRERSDLTEAQMQDLADDFAKGAGGNCELTLDGTKYYMVYESTDIQRWILVGLVPVEVVNANMNQLWIITVQIMVGITSGIAFIIILMIINTGHIKLRRKNTEILYREELFSKLSQNVDDVFMMLDATTYNLDYISPNMERLLGLTKESICKNIGTLAILNPNDTPESEKNCLAKIAAGEQCEWDKEIIHRQTGERRWFHVVAMNSEIEGQTKYILVLSDRTADKQLNRTLSDAVAAAENANRAKSTFLSNMSHDIRTPMNAIIGFTNIALHQDSVPEMHNCLKKIEESSDHLLSLLNDVLDLSRIESGKVEFSPVPANITAVTDSVIEIVKGMLLNRELNFEVHREPLQNPYVMTEPVRIREILVNILNNAVKFTKDGGTIRFDAGSRPGADAQHIVICYRIKDTGIGMSEEFQKKLFDEFAQEENGGRTQYKGTGLGMPISKKYVELMGGTITVDSRKGVGTTFTVEIPMELTNAEKVEKTKPLVQHNDLKRIKVLLAEDNDLNAELATILLEDLGMTVTRAADGQEVVDLFAEHPAGTYDIILMDIMMPKMDGHQAAKAIRAMYADRPDAEEIPIIALSANAFSEDVQASLDAGMNGHVSKPLNMEEVTKVIERNLNRP